MIKALILCAGVGKRLGEVNQNLPKCLLSFLGKTLLERHLENLHLLGITDITLVTGYQSFTILDFVQSKTLFSSGVKIVYNPHYEQGSVVSLLTGMTELQEKDYLILMDADVLYHPDILARLVTSEKENCFLVDRQFEEGTEPVKICIKDEKMVEFRKLIDPQLQFDTWGESVGFFKFNATMNQNLFKRCQNYLEEGKENQPHEEVLRDLLLEIPEAFSYEDITGLPWLEIDFPEDIERAKKTVLPFI